MGLTHAVVLLFLLLLLRLWFLLLSWLGLGLHLLRLLVVALARELGKLLGVKLGKRK